MSAPSEPADESLVVEIDEPDVGPVVTEPVVIETSPTVAPAVEESPLKAQVEAQQRAENLQKQLDDMSRSQAEAQRQLQQAQREREQERGDREEAQYSSILSAIGAEEAALEAAERELASAMGAQDWSTAAKAQRIISQAAGRLDRLGENKTAFDNRRDDQRRNPPQASTTSQNNLPARAQDWLREHPEFMSDTRRNQDIQAAHSYITTRKGIAAFSDAYFDALDQEFGFKTSPTVTTTSTPQSPPPERRSIPVTAPVSRDAPSTSGTRQKTEITLSPEQREVARNSFGPVWEGDGKGNGKWVDLTNPEKERLYAINLRKLAQKRANGTYHHTSEELG